jgi:hypothetical protein
MTRTLLSLDEIKELCEIVSNVFSYIKNLKDEKELSKHIQYPKIPSILSESIIIHLIREGRLLNELTRSRINFGGRVADIITESNPIKKIEVKATGKSAFEYFGEKDIVSDYIIWVHFAESFINNNFSNIEIFTIRNPRKYFNETIKITLNKLQEMVGNGLEKIILNLNDL